MDVLIRPGRALKDHPRSANTLPRPVSLNNSTRRRRNSSSSNSTTKIGIRTAMAMPQKVMEMATTRALRGNTTTRTTPPGERLRIQTTQSTTTLARCLRTAPDLDPRGEGGHRCPEEGEVP